jgi:putative methionine-R-sulfoxide reductase with GAF domain
MPEIEYKKAAVESIKHSIKVLNGIVLLIIYALLFLIVRFLYVILNYIPMLSVVTIMSIIAGLVAIGLYLANNASKKAIITIDDYAKKFNLLLTTTKNIKEIVHSDVLLENIMDNSLKITGADAGSILLLEGDKLVFRIVRGSKSTKLLGFSIPKSQGIAGWVMENGTPIRIENAQEDSRFDSEVDKATGYETKSLMCIPLNITSGTIGVLELVNKRQESFTLEDQELISYFADQAAISIRRVKFFEDQKNYEIHLTNILVDTMDSHIIEKRGHQKRVAKYCLLMGRAINMSEEEKKRLYRVCLLHDIGFLKIKINEITTSEEYKAHSKLGYEILKPISFYTDIADIVLYHHERYDGKGYPTGIAGESIPLESRMIAIAEAFDAMVSQDSYKYKGKFIDKTITPPVHNFKSALEELKNNTGTQFDAELVDIFARNLSETSINEA